MSNLADASLVVMALACVVAVVALIPVLIEMRRAVARAERMINAVQGDLPSLLADLRVLVTKLDRTADALAALGTAVDNLNNVVDGATRKTRQVEGWARQKLLGNARTLVANAAGVAAVAREGVGWIVRPNGGRPRRQ